MARLQEPGYKEQAWYHWIRRETISQHATYGFAIWPEVRNVREDVCEYRPITDTQEACLTVYRVSAAREFTHLRASAAK